MTVRALGWLAPLALCAAAAAAQERPDLPCAPTDKPCLFKALREHRANRAASWSEALARPVEQRFGPAPPMLVESLTLDNLVSGFPERPRAARPDDAFLADFTAAFSELPLPVRRALGAGFAGIYFVEDLGGSGFTNYVWDASRRIVGSYVVLDAAVLARRRANEWATWKENTPFRAAHGFSLRATIQDAAADNRRNAIQDILLHELGHAISVGMKIHPEWSKRPAEVREGEDYPYFRMSWRLDRAGDRYESHFDRDFPQRKDVVYYLGARLDARDMRPVYERLEKTNFATLYAATSPADDFAEAFANYVHVVMLKRPFEVALLEGDRVTKRYRACWDEPRCAAKRKVLEALLSP